MRAQPQAVRDPARGDGEDRFANHVLVFLGGDLHRRVARRLRVPFSPPHPRRAGRSPAERRAHPQTAAIELGHVREGGRVEERLVGSPHREHAVSVAAGAPRARVVGVGLPDAVDDELVGVHPDGEEQRSLEGAVRPCRHRDRVDPIAELSEELDAARLGPLARAKPKGHGLRGGGAERRRGHAESVPDRRRWRRRWRRRAARGMLVLVSCVRFVGTLVGVEVLGRRAMKVVPIGFDYRFAVTVIIETGTGEAPWLEPGSEVAFGIHSPARAGLGPWETPPIGKAFSFEVTRGETGWTWLSARPCP